MNVISGPLIPSKSTWYLSMKLFLCKKWEYACSCKYTRFNVYHLLEKQDFCKNCFCAKSMTALRNVGDPSRHHVNVLSIMIGSVGGCSAAALSSLHHCVNVREQDLISQTGDSQMQALHNGCAYILRHGIALEDVTLHLAGYRRHCLVVPPCEGLQSRQHKCIPCLLCILLL